MTDRFAELRAEDQYRPTIDIERQIEGEEILAELERDPALTDDTKDLLRRAFEWCGMKGGGL